MSQELYAELKDKGFKHDCSLSQTEERRIVTTEDKAKELGITNDLAYLLVYEWDRGYCRHQYHYMSLNTP